MSFRISRRIRISALTLAALLGLYAIFGFWWVPRLVRSQVQTFSQQHWQRQPVLGDITFNPFTLALQVHAFDFRDSAGEPVLSFGRLLVNVDLASLWRRGLSFHVIELDRPNGRLLVHADGSVNLAELVAPFAPKPGDKPAEDAGPTRLFIDRFRLKGGVFEFEDHARATPFKARLTPVDFELLDFGTTGDNGNQYSLQATSSAGERFRWSGSFGLSPLQSRGDFQLEAVQARTLWSYLRESLGFEITEGLVALQGRYELASTEPDFTLDVTLSQAEVAGLALRSPGGTEDWVRLDRIDIGNVKAALNRRLLDVGTLRVTGGKVLARRGTDGTVNLLSLAAPKPASGATEAPDMARAQSPSGGGASGWIVNAPAIQVTGLEVALLDEFVKPTGRFTLAPVEIDLKGFSTAPDQTLNLVAGFTLDTGGTFSLQASGIPADRSYSGRLTLEELNLAALQPYVGSYTQMTLLSGTLGATLEAEWLPDRYRLAGDLHSSRLHAVDDALREDFIKWDRVAVTGIEYRSRPESLSIGAIAARAPYVRLIIAPDQTTNIAKILTAPGTAPGPVQTVQGTGQDPTGRTTPMAMSIGRIRVDNGSANFADFWITPNYAVSLQQLAGTITGLSSRRDSRARVALNGKIDRYAPVEIAGELNLLSASLFTDLRVKFDGVELTSVTPYSGRFAGYRIEKGKLSVDVRYLVENRKLEAEQRFIVDQLTLGERVDSPDAVKLPLRLAVALLKDRNGVIDLGLPVSGSLDDPKFRIGPIVWKAFVNLLTGIATSPFRMLGGMFGGGEEVNLIDFAPGSATLDAAATEKLGALTRALRERPQLALEVPAVWTPDADAAVLAARQLDARLEAIARSRQEASGAAADPAGRFELLLALHRADRKDAALPPGAQALQAARARDREPTALAAANAELELVLRAGVETLEPELQALAQQRARAIQDALLSSGEVEPGRVFMLASGAQPAVAEKARIALSLK